MNEFKGTPGKWEFSEYRNGSSSLKVYDYVFGEIYHNDSQKSGEFEANQALISSAPELLHACQEALKELQFHDWHNTKTGFMLQKAINEALGL